MPIRQWTLIAVEAGMKRRLVWKKGGELLGDDDLIARFQQSWNSRDQEAFRLSLPKQMRAHFRVEMAGEILRGLCVETLDIWRGWVSTPEELQAIADQWNTREDNHQHFTAEDVSRLEAEQQERDHRGPPYSWQEIAPLLDAPAEPDQQPPEDTPKCLECLQPMEWVWFVSDPVTWGNALWPGGLDAGLPHLQIVAGMSRCHRELTVVCLNLYVKVCLNNAHTARATRVAIVLRQSAGVISTISEESRMRLIT